MASGEFIPNSKAAEDSQASSSTASSDEPLQSLNDSARLCSNIDEENSSSRPVPDSAEPMEAKAIALGHFNDDHTPQGRALKRIGFLLLNAWLVFHLFAIVVGPASADPASPLMQDCFDLIAPYLQTLYLDHGFRFFVPEPGASTLVLYQLEFADGSSKTGRFPDRSTVPRLFYHRHFMVSEFLGNTEEDFQPFVERAIARNLCRETGAIRVTITRVTHDTPSIEDVRNGMTLQDPSLFTETLLGTYTPEELRLPIVLPLKEKRDGTESSDPVAENLKVLP